MKTIKKICLVVALALLPTSMFSTVHFFHNYKTIEGMKILIKNEFLIYDSNLNAYYVAECRDGLYFDCSDQTCDYPDACCPCTSSN